MIPVISSNKRAKRGTTYTFNQADGALSGWDYTNSAWTVASNRAKSTPTLGAELFVNGTFAADANWTKGAGWTISGGVANKAAGAATNLTQAVATVGNWYRVGFDIASISAGILHTWYGTNTSGVIGYQYSTTGSKISTGRVITANTLGWRSDAATVASVDNATAKLITLSDMMATKASQKLYANIRASATITTDTHAGLVGWLDSHTSPANFIIFTHNGEFARCVKCVAGTYTSLNNLAVPYVAGAEMRLWATNVGGEFRVFAAYNGTIVSNGVAVADAGIISNTRHGLFSSYEGNLFSRITIA